jgi:hypothetical protein
METPWLSPFLPIRTMTPTGLRGAFWPSIRSGVASPEVPAPTTTRGLASSSRGTTTTRRGAPRRPVRRTPTVGEQLQVIAGVSLVCLLLGGALLAWLTPEPTSVDDLFQPHVVGMKP